MSWKRINMPQDEGEEVEGDEAKEETDDRNKKCKSEGVDKKDNAADGDWELPSIFRTLRGSDQGLHKGMNCTCAKRWC